MEIGQPRLLTAGAMVAICAYGLLLMVPVIIAMLVVSVLKLGVLTFLLPLLTIAAGTYFLPFGFGNSYVAKLVRSLDPAAGKEQNGFIVQLTFTPRLWSGIRALIEDADDIGWLSFTESTLVFRGDCVRFSIPFEHIRDVRTRNSGWRGLFVYGPGSSFVVSGLPNVTSIRLAERSARLLPASRRNARVLQQRLLQICGPS
jgi:hypothetical protein